jgi:hypothetical protein
VTTLVSWRRQHTGQAGPWQALPFSAISTTLVVIVGGLLLAAAQARALAAHPVVRLAADAPASAILLSGVYAPEHDTRAGFRWSTGDTRLAFDVPVQAGATLVGIQLGPSAPALVGEKLRVSVWDRQLAEIAIDGRPERYELLVPSTDARAGRLELRLHSAAVVVPPDTRAVGVRVEGLTVQPQGAGPALPPYLLVAAQLGILALCAAVLRGARVPASLAGAGVALACAGLGLAYYAQGPFVYPIYARRILVALALLALLTYGALPLVVRTCAGFASARLVRGLWLAALLACALRLIGSLYPLFSAYDLALNLQRFLAAAGGDLVQTNEAFEFRGGVTVYPPGPYLVLLPALLLGVAPKLIVQAGIALVDGFGALAVGLLARVLGASERGALLGAALYATIPIGLTSLYYGHAAEIFAQSMIAPLAIALLLALRGGGGRHWLVAGVLLSVAMLSHIGVTILAVAWLGLAWLALRVRGSVSARAWRRLTLVLVLSCVVGGLFAYAPVVVMQLRELQKVGRHVVAGASAPAYSLIARALLISYHQLGLPLLLVGLALARHRPMPQGARELTAAWGAAAILFWAVEMLSGLQVRYFVFFTPLACILIGLALDRLASRGGAGRGVAWLIVLLLSVQAGVLWYGGAFANVAPSMVPLLR